MAKISGPLLSLAARGSVGPRLTFSLRPSGQQARFQRSQTDFDTSARTIERDFFIEATEQWATLTADNKQDWTDYIF